MKISKPEVTLADEARNGVEEDVRSGFLDWLCAFAVKGDDNKEYNVGGAILSLALEKKDVVSMGYTCGDGTVEQLQNSIYKIARFPGQTFDELIAYPQGTLKIVQEEHRVVVDCPGFHVECYEDNSWRLLQNSKNGEYKADLWHTPQGFPLWYGKDTPSYLTQHSVTYGYNWAGKVEGTIWLEGKEIKVSGNGIRERYVAVDSSAAELGGWEDWGWITFDELHSSMYDMRLGMKDQSVYLVDEKIHYPEGKQTIEHEEWAFLRELGGFIPTVYKITIETEGGVYRAKAHVKNATTWGVTHKVPDYPVATLLFDNVQGTFTFNDGKIKTLHNGRGSMSIRQWHAYPNILPRELYSDEVKTGEKFATL